MNHPKMLVIGEKGFLSSYLRNSAVLSNKYIVKGTSRVGHPKLDLADLNTLNEFEEHVSKFQPNYIVIAAAVPDVELCAKDPAGTRKINVHGIQNILEISSRHSVMPVFFSSDYALSPISQLRLMDEHEECSPRTEYGRQKREIEDWIDKKFDRYLVFRTSKLISMYTHPRNILSQIAHDLREKKSVTAFQDQWITPVFLEDIARILSHDKLDTLSGIYHLATTIPYTRYELATKVKQMLQLGEPSVVEASSMATFKSLEERPRFNTLSSEKICSELGFKFTEISEFQDIGKL